MEKSNETLGTWLMRLISSLVILAALTISPAKALECTTATYGDWDCEAWWVWNQGQGEWILVDAAWTRIIIEA